ncbi:MAG TPA: MFS transporter [Acidimicrobiales bacterium]|nr:MFS transporter [Acidimicrobiales bacterium]
MSTSTSEARGVSPRAIATSLIVAVSFLTLLNALSNAGTFFLLATLTLAALGYFRKMVPETKGLSLEQIERELD